MNSVEDIAGNGLLETYSLSFTTELEPDIIAPKIQNTNPENNSVDVPLEQ